MGIKLLAVGAAAAVLLAPGAAILGVATLISPAAAGSGSCMWDGHAAESLGVSGPVPNSLSATNTNGESVTLSEPQLTRAAAIIASGQSETIPGRGQMIARFRDEDAGGIGRGIIVEVPRRAPAPVAAIQLTQRQFDILR